MKRPLVLPASVKTTTALLFLGCCFAAAGAAASSVSEPPTAEPERVEDSLIVYYPFTEGSGGTAADHSGIGEPLDLSVSAGVEWLSGRNGVRLPGGQRLVGLNAAKVREAAVESGQVSIEVWAKPSNLAQDGPARILTYSRDDRGSNFTIEQELSMLQLRFRTITADRSALTGAPAVAADEAMTDAPTHLLVTYDGAWLSIYRDGQLLRSESRAGVLSSWDPAYALVIGDDFQAPRSWAGEVYLAAIYNRALSPDEVQRNFAAGPLLGEAGGAGPGMPTLTVDSPADGSSFVEGEMVMLRGTAKNGAGVDMSNRIFWTSSIDGDLGTGREVPAQPSVGTHSIRASFVDDEGRRTSQYLSVLVGMAPPNGGPTLTVSSPLDGSSFVEGEVVMLRGSGKNEAGVDMSNRIFWTSSIDGGFGSGHEVAARPSVGEHSIRASFVDDEGRRASRYINITITPNSGGGGGEPTLTVISPSDGASFAEGEVVMLRGTAKSGTGVDMSNRIFWTSSIDGGFGSGHEVAARPSVGEHSIRASFVDDEGRRASRYINITITPNSGGGGGEPTLTVNSPTDGASFAEGEVVMLRGTAKNGAGVRHVEPDLLELEYRRRIGVGT